MGSPFPVFLGRRRALWRLGRRRSCRAGPRSLCGVGKAGLAPPLLWHLAHV